MAIKNDFVVKHGLTVTNTATINQDLIVVGSIKKNGVDVGFGYTGSQGNIGYTGSQGIQGVTGYTGSQGNIGYTGSQGNIGYTGSQGAQGIAGYTGSQGVIGYTGSKGDSGLGFTIAKTYASVAALTADTTPTGIVAGQFALIETGDVENPENSRLYLWNGSAYTYVSDLSGAQGITGPQGVIGYTGSQGTQGVIGYTGSQGVIGYTGSQGTQGVIGYTGSAGPSNVLNATASSASEVQYFVGVPVTGSNQTPNASTTVPVVFQPSTGNVGIGATPSVPLEVRKSATGSNVIQRVGISGQTKNPYLESKFDETNGVVTLNASGSSTPAFTFEIAQSEKIRIDSNGNINIPTLGARITGDFSNPTVSNRLMFQSSTTNGNTLVGAVPNGTAGSVGFYAFGGSDLSNVAYAGIASSNGVSNIVSGITGTGTYQPLIMTTGGAERMRIDTAGNVGVGTSNPFNASGYGSLTLNGPTGSITSYQVNGTEKFRIQAKADSTEINLFSTNPLTIYANNAERMRIGANGNVGIGTNAPAAVLDVNGASASNIVAVAASDVNCSLGNYFTKTINGATTFTFSNVPASRAFSFVLAVTHTSGAITWPAAVSWPNSTAPTLTTGKTHLFVFVTSDGGSTWRGNSSVNY